MGVGADRCPFSMEKQLGQLVADDLGYSYRADKMDAIDP